MTRNHPERPSADDRERTTRRRGWGSTAAFAVCAGFLLGGSAWIGATVHSDQQQSSRREQWMQRVEDRGATAHIAGYSSSGALSRIPFVEALVTRTHVEVMLPSTDVAAAVIPLLREYPELDRIWIHKHDVDPESVEQIKATRPEVQVIFYTPAPT